MTCRGIWISNYFEKPTKEALKSDEMEYISFWNTVLVQCALPLIILKISKYNKSIRGNGLFYSELSGKYIIYRVYRVYIYIPARQPYLYPAWPRVDEGDCKNQIFFAQSSTFRGGKMGNIIGQWSLTGDLSIG